MRYFRTAVLLTAISVTIPILGFGQNSDRITLKIDFLSQHASIEKLINDLNKAETSQKLLVYADGQYLGVAPGVFGFELDNDGTIIEIGLPEFKNAPLYSFVISNENIKNNLVYVNYSEIDYNIYNKSDDLLGLENTIISTRKTAEKLSFIEGSYYNILIDSEPYSKKLNVEKSVYGMILDGYGVERQYNTAAKYYAGFQFVKKGLAPHDMYGVQQALAAGRPVVPAMQRGEITWSGFSGTGIGLVPDKKLETWEISSTPVGAEVLFGRCSVRYQTTVRTRIRSDCLESMVLRIDGFEQCPFDSHKVETAGEVKKFHCHLVEIQSH